MANGWRERHMVEGTHRFYELALSAIGRAANAPNEAATFVERLQPCHGSQRYHDCPERAALFAGLTASDAGWIALRHFLPLLAPPRWLFTAEGYERDGSCRRRGARANARRVSSASRNARTC